MIIEFRVDRSFKVWLGTKNRLAIFMPQGYGKSAGDEIRISKMNPPEMRVQYGVI